MDDFWNKWDLSGPSIIDHALGPVAALTDKFRAEAGLSLPVESGTRVAFKYNTGSVLTYDNIPDEGVRGVVVKVKTSTGNRTSSDGLVYVKWDDGQFRPVFAEHLEMVSGEKQASSISFRAADLSSLSGSFITASDNELVHKATKDLWSFRQEGEGFFIERLFDSVGEPLKL